MKRNMSTKKRRQVRVKRLVIILASFLLVLVIAFAAIPFFIMPQFLGQRYEQTQFSSDDYGIESERITLTTDDNISIAAWRTRAEEPKGTVIIISGIQNPSVTAFFGYAKMFADNGWDSLLIEMRARSQSGGDEIGLGMTEWLDVKAGVDFLTNDPDVKDLPITALGTSMGGAVALISAGELPEIDAVISISAFYSWSSMFAEYMALSGVPKPLSTLEKPFINMYLGFHFGFGALKYSPANALEKLGGRPLLMMHSTEDTQVPYSEFEALLAEAGKHNLTPQTFIREGDEHIICYEEYADDPMQDIEFSTTILEFLESSFS